MRRWILFGAIVGLAIGIPLAAASSSASSAKQPKPCPPEGSDAVNFSAYYLGDAFRGHALTKTLRVCNESRPTGARQRQLHRLHLRRLHPRQRFRVRAAGRSAKRACV